MIRSAHLSDIPRLMEIRGRVRENRLADPSKVTPVDYVCRIKAGHLWVGEQDGRVAGFSACDAASCRIWALFVEPDCEGRGIGAALLARAVDALAANGCVKAQLTTDSGTRAEAFYRHLGWREAGFCGGEMVFELGLT